MGTQLQNVLRFTNLVVGAPTAILHRLNIDEIGQLPDIIAPNAAGFVITADDIEVTVTRGADAPDAVDIWVEHWHTVNREFGAFGNFQADFPGITAPPFIIQAGAAAAAGGREILAPLFTQSDVAANQSDVHILVGSGSGNSRVRVNRPGSIVGIGSQLTALITAGSLIAEVSINGAGTGFLITHTAASGPSGITATQAKGLDTFVAGNQIGVRITTDGAFAPTTTDLDVWVEVNTG